MLNQKQLALAAIELVTPAIERLFHTSNRQTLHIVVMDPSTRPWESSFEESILVEHTLGDRETWTAPFDELARKKAHQAWRDRTANIQHQTQHPSMLQQGDVLYYGSFKYGEIIVACSGVEQWFDMLVSGWIAVAMEQLAIHEYQKSKVETPTKAFVS